MRSAGPGLAGPLINVFAPGSRDYGIPGCLLDVARFAGLTAGDVVFRVVDDQQSAAPLVGTVVLDFLDIAQINVAATVSLRLRILLAQPHGHEVSRTLHLMVGAVGGPGAVRRDSPELPAAVGQGT